jgi:hypothetical protein
MSIRRTALSLFLSCSTFLAEASAATVAQNGDYLYTMVRDNGVHSRTVTRQVNERAMERLSVRVPEKMARIQARYEARAARGRGCAVARSSDDQASLVQSGEGGVASLTQLGNNDNLAVSQTGVDDVAYALQLGNNQQATIEQNGNHDLAVVIERCRPVRAWTFAARLAFSSREDDRATEAQ